MNENQFFDTIQKLDIREMIQTLGAEGHILTTPEIIALAAAAVIGLLLCVFGLKIARVWAALIGLAAGFAVGAAAGGMLGLEGYGMLIAGGVLGVLLAVLGAAVYRAGVFLLVFFSASGFSVGLVNPQGWIPTAVCLAVSLVLAILAIRFITALTIIATSLCGGLTAGAAVYYLLPVTGEVIMIILCVLFCVLGIILQLLLESGRQKKKSLKKAEEIRSEKSTANEVERARAMMDNLDEMPEEEHEEEEHEEEDHEDEDHEEDYEEDDITVIEFDTDDLTDENKK